MSAKIKTSPDGHSLEIPDNAVIEVHDCGVVNLTSPEFDPFGKFKTDEERYHYRALNVRPQNLRERIAQGYETIPGSEFGDLILGQIPKEVHQRQVAHEEARTKAQQRSAVERFKADAAKLNVKTFEED